MNKPKEIHKQVEIGRLIIVFSWRDKDLLWGRFGGGWNWHVGFQAGGKTLIIFLLVCSLRFEWRKKS